MELVAERWRKFVLNAMQQRAVASGVWPLASPFAWQGDPLHSGEDVRALHAVAAGGISVFRAGAVNSLICGTERGACVFHFEMQSDAHTELLKALSSAHIDTKDMALGMEYEVPDAAGGALEATLVLGVSPGIKTIEVQGSYIFGSVLGTAYQHRQDALDR